MDTHGPFVRAAEIERSLAAFAARCGDPAPIVYARLFAAHPDMEDQFRRDTRGLIRGEMLARAFEVILDCVDGRQYADAMVQAEMVTHDSYGVPSDIFVSFFTCIRDAVRETLAETWSSEIDTAWADLLCELRALAGVAQPA